LLSTPAAGVGLDEQIEREACSAEIIPAVDATDHLRVYDAATGTLPQLIRVRVIHYQTYGTPLTA